MFNSDKGFGFIIGEDGNDYFAHISNVNSMQELHTGLFVSFEPNENDKGKYATKIMVIESKKPTFIAFGDVRIKTSNIKNYGIASGIRWYAKVYQYLPSKSDALLDKMFGLRWKWCGDIIELSKNGNGYRYIKSKRDGKIKQGNRDYGAGYMSESDYIKKDIPYLYVTTYQNDNYEFWEDEVKFDIKAKCKEIDDCML